MAPAPRELATILGEVIRRQRCLEIVVEYSCGHSTLAEVHMAPFLQDKRDPRAAARALKLACRRNTLPVGEESIFRIEVPGGACATCGKGSRTSLRCGGVSMDLVSAREEQGNQIPVGVGARQLLQWLQLRSSEAEDSQRIHLTSVAGTSWYHFFTTPGTLGPVLLGLVFWLFGCILYAFYAAPQMPMVSPEVFYREVMDQIEHIPVPRRSPHFAHYRQYYLQQYQEHLHRYRELEADLGENPGPRFQWSAFLQGLGLGAWVFGALLALCEYQYGTITAWMEVAEEWWMEWRRKSRSTSSKDHRTVDTAAQEVLLKDLLGSGTQAEASAPAGSSAATRASERKPRQEKQRPQQQKAADRPAKQKHGHSAGAGTAPATRVPAKKPPVEEAADVQRPAEAEPAIEPEPTAAAQCYTDRGLEHEPQEPDEKVQEEEEQVEADERDKALPPEEEVVQQEQQQTQEEEEDEEDEELEEEPKAVEQGEQEVAADEGGHEGAEEEEEEDEPEAVDDGARGGGRGEEALAAPQGTTGDESEDHCVSDAPTSEVAVDSTATSEADGSLQAREQALRKKHAEAQAEVTRLREALRRLAGPCSQASCLARSMRDIARKGTTPSDRLFGQLVAEVEGLRRQVAEASGQVTQTPPSPSAGKGQGKAAPASPQQRRPPPGTTATPVRGRVWLASGRGEAAGAVKGEAPSYAAVVARKLPKEKLWDPAGVFEATTTDGSDELTCESVAQFKDVNEDPSAGKWTLMRADAPEFVPTLLQGLPAGAILVPYALPSDGSMAGIPIGAIGDTTNLGPPAGHVLVIGGMPDGILTADGIMGGMPQGCLLIPADFPIAMQACDPTVEEVLIEQEPKSPMCDD